MLTDVANQERGALSSSSQLLFGMLLLTLFLAPWPVGSNRDWAWPILTLLLVFIAVALLVGRCRLEDGSVKWVMLSFAGLTAWI